MTLDPDIKENKPRGCGVRLLQAFISFWIISLSIVTQIVTWFTEQAIFEGSISGKDFRWIIILVFGLSQMLPAVLLMAAAKGESQRALSRTWLAASVFVLLTAPLRILPLTDEISLRFGQIAILVFLLICINLIMKSRYFPFSVKGSIKNSETARVALVAAITGIPWVLYGALGSPLDTILGIAVGILFGLFIGGLLLPAGLPAEMNTTPGKSMLGTGWVFLLVSLVTATGLGQNGNQWLISFTIPAYAGLFWLFSRGIDAGHPATRWIFPALLVGSAAAWPLVWYDADELMFVIASSQGEVITWAARSAGLSVITVLILTIIMVILNRKNWPILNRAGVFLTGAVFSWVFLAGVYFYWGQPGFFGERLFVILNDQRDISEAASIGDYQQRRQFVYSQLVQEAEHSQREIREMLDRFKIQYRPYYLVNAVEIEGGPILRHWLENQPEVNRVLASPKLRPLASQIPVSSGTESRSEEALWNLGMIGAPKVWDLGIRGDGIVIGQSDSGVQGDHPELASSYRGKSGTNDYNWYDPWYSSLSPVDIGGHGTQTLGTILGDTVGIAPQAEWIGCVNLARNLGNPALYLDCLQFMLAPFPQNGDPFVDGKPEFGAHVLNNSWGCPEFEGCDPQSLFTAINALRTAGIFVVASAGNSGNGECSTVSDPPALYDSAYSVGAINREGQLAPFSSIGPVAIDGSLRTKPDIAAPGVDVLSAFPNNTYQVASGTSMASPHAAGVVALIWSANPELIGNIEKTEEILNQSAAEYSGGLPACVDGNIIPNNAVGFGIINALDAVNLAIDQGTTMNNSLENIQ